METLIISRHPDTVAYLKSLYPEATVFSGNVTAKDVKNKDVIGNLPMHLAAKCGGYTAVELPTDCPRGQELDLEYLSANVVLRRYHIADINPQYGFSVSTEWGHADVIPGDFAVGYSINNAGVRLTLTIPQRKWDKLVAIDVAAGEGNLRGFGSCIDTAVLELFWEQDMLQEIPRKKEEGLEQFRRMCAPVHKDTHDKNSERFGGRTM